MRQKSNRLPTGLPKEDWPPLELNHYRRDTDDRHQNRGPTEASNGPADNEGGKVVRDSRDEGTNFKDGDSWYI